MNKLSEKARREGYNARSVYKLFEINKKFNLIKKNDFVLDIGCWPGSWTQACLEFGAVIVGVDKKKTNVKNVKFVQADIMEEDIFGKVKGKYDVVISDVAPSTIGVRELDQSRSTELTERAFEIACEFLKCDGNFLAKIFQSGDTSNLINKIRKKFKSVNIFKPKSSKIRSKEVYIVAKGFR